MDEKYIEKAKQDLAAKVIIWLHSDNIDKGEIIENIIEAALTESYEKGHDEGYREAMNEASYEYDRKMGYL